MNTESALDVDDTQQTLNRFYQDVVEGLSKPQKKLSPKYFYDERGSQLFEQICTLDEYYVTRTETAIMQTHIAEMADLLGSNVLLIELGSGNSAKTRFLLTHLQSLAAYVPVDISEKQLREVAAALAADYPAINIVPVYADYTDHFDLPPIQIPHARKVVYFPGSTIGNFELPEARQFLKRIAQLCGSGGRLLIGIDLKKDPTLLHAAYNDSEGVTALFNLNLLERINRELGADFDLVSFSHYAFYNPHESRIEMHLVSKRKQTVRLGNAVFSFANGESIWTESSQKFNPEEFIQMAEAAGFSTDQIWFDLQRWFGVLCCKVR